ncbi:MAG: BA14K family protein, partial [Bradyrhizobium sp.]|uniref:BA14K family protein n=1 Tax=Bradyrhizobium sp. TaxID=376 RepID=UPI001E183218
PGPYYAPAPVYADPGPGVDPDSDPVAYCSARFRSYDPRSGTYLGYDGLRHPCP